MALSDIRSIGLASHIEPSMPAAKRGDVLVMAENGRISWARVYRENSSWSELQWTVQAEKANIDDNVWVASGVESIEAGTTVADEQETLDA